LHTAFSVETHPAEVQWLEKQVRVVKFRMLRVGIRRLAVPGTKLQHLGPLKGFIQNSIKVTTLIMQCQQF
jgi:hypothetical protein